jgi:hypothetical protein
MSTTPVVRVPAQGILALGHRPLSAPFIASNTVRTCHAINSQPNQPPSFKGKGKPLNNTGPGPEQAN